jgi:peroxiredoxin
MKEIADFDAHMAQFEAANAQVVGVSPDAAATLDAFRKVNAPKHLLLSDFRRTMLPGWGAMNTDEKSPTFRYSKRAYFILDKEGTVKYVKVQDNALDLLKAEEILKALKDSGA